MTYAERLYRSWPPRDVAEVESRLPGATRDVVNRVLWRAHDEYERGGRWWVALAHAVSKEAA